MAIKNQNKYLRIFALIIVIIGISYGSSALSERARCSNFNGKPIPHGVEIVECKTMINDNFFHSAKFMKIDHSKGFGNLLQAVNAPDEYESYSNNSNFQDSDAIWELGSINDALNLNIKKEEIERGYEIETTGRDNWLLVGRNNISYYIEN